MPQKKASETKSISETKGFFRFRLQISPVKKKDYVKQKKFLGILTCLFTQFYCTTVENWIYKIVYSRLQISKHYLQMDSLGESIDWGTLAVYTCANSCDSTDTAYHQEFIWKQDFSTGQI